MSTVKVCYHARCFDGLASAAMFTRFYRQQVDGSATFEYQGLSHGSPDPVDPGLLSGDVNAIVDFRYSASPRLDWWFDHHRSAFVTPQERARFDEKGNPQHYWDPTEPSNTGFLVRTCGRRFGFDPEPVSEIVRWLDIIDAARFPDARTAVERPDPALHLMAICEGVGDGPVAEYIIDGLAAGDLHGVATSPEVTARYQPLAEAQRQSLETVKTRIKLFGDVALVDLAEDEGLAFNKFAPYYLHPEVTYVVVVQAQPERIKLGVGANPWRPDARRHNIADICEQFGGGGHPVVGGITLTDGSAGLGRQIARDVVDQLLTEPL